MATQVRMPDGSIRTTSDLNELMSWVGNPAERGKAQQGGRGQIVGGNYSADFLNLHGAVAPEARGGAVGNAPGVDPNKPLYPALDSWISTDAKGNPTLKDNLIYRPSGEGFQGIREIATAKPGTSLWEKMMLERQGLEESSQRDALDRGAASSRAMGFSDLARRGGASSGARLSLARSSLRDLMAGRQDLNRAGMGQRLGIGTQAEQNRVGALGNLAGMEEGASKLNIQNLLTQKRLEDAAKLGKYGEEMRGWAANKQADATANSGKK